jgi:hypothetical protein
LAYEKLPVNFLSKKSGINEAYLKPMVYKKLSKMLIPRTWGFFKAIECLIELVDMVRKVRILKTRGCFTYTNSCKGPFKKALFTSICCNLKL